MMSLLQAPSYGAVPRRTDSCQVTPAAAVRCKQPTRQTCGRLWPPPQLRLPPHELNNPHQACHPTPCRLATPQARRGGIAIIVGSLP
uniref:Uncharacterized protein n=1 Tax=Setaria viridis TaxID=4556 RepID=A0A4U6T6J6_SETVI|nr:hypothetical protein SEVIR_9G380650v2 [Setaria viridis]